ncbi:Predicted oxidoreductase [Chryseolinea serpens]|uniref:Predicted oxidoreductase n=1 Tax=Chryseolinea serpens TaxID=947013 RepID=A0A1M5LD26_9BACT|nr:aldo/keto reductase [Chryseolinea serpens]SHG62870.1 Predicted oxidoreductase [Chryseolinea serpens]
MQYNPLGTSDLNVSEVSFGCMSLGSDDAANAQLLHRAHDEGINYFDTADIYNKGQNEITVGKALAGRRDKVIIATKAGNVWRADGSGLDWNPSKDHILRSATQSLKRLRTDYIDLYQLHGGTINDPIDETIEAFEMLVSQGKIRYYGISSIRPNVIREYVERSNIVSVMMQYSLLDRRPEEECLKLLNNHSISVLVRGSLASGLLIDKPAKSYLNYSEQDVTKLVQVMKNVSQSKRSLTEIALNFALAPDAVASAVVGMRTEKQLMNVLEAASTLPLSVRELDAFNVLPANTYQDHC